MTTAWERLQYNSDARARRIAIAEQAERTRAAVREAFSALRRKGYFARMNFMCCQTCGWATMPPGRDSKALFYMAQDAEALDATGHVRIAWAGDAREILTAFKAAGLALIWDGSPDSRFEVFAP